MDNVVTQIEALDLPMFSAKDLEDPVPGDPHWELHQEAVKWDLQLWPVEKKLYRYLGEGWDELCYYFLRGFSQVIISQFFGCLQTMISAFERQLVERLRLWNDHLLPTLEAFKDVEPLFLRAWPGPRQVNTPGYLRALVYTTDIDYVYKWFYRQSEGNAHTTGVVQKSDIQQAERWLEWCKPVRTQADLDGGPQEPEFTADEVRRLREFGKFAYEHFTLQPKMEGGFAMRELTTLETDTPNIRHSTSLYKEKYAK